MNRSTVLGCIFSILGLGTSSNGSPAALTPPQLEQLAQSANVIVIMRDQLPAIPPTREGLGARRAALSDSHRSVVAELQRAGATKIYEFSTINAIATTVATPEVETLAANPQVQEVVEDAVIHRKPRFRQSIDSVVGKHMSSAGNSLCNTLEPQALQLTNTAFLDDTIPQAQSVRDGNGELITGRGVKVAVIFADGLDTTIPGFTHRDGSPVFTDYQNFSGDPAGTPMYGDEAFLDASSVAAQDDPNGRALTFDISKYAGAGSPLPSPCNIRIRGMAPGAALMGVQLGTTLGDTTVSDDVRGIEYAVTNGADIIDETFSVDVFPATNRDPISLANTGAVAAGVTVIVAAGDAGSASTITTVGPEVIAVGASTSFRLYAQLDFSAFSLSSGGYLNDNISSLSSGGFTPAGRTVDVVAPGDLGWSLCSENAALFIACSSYYTGNDSPVQLAGGTSESAPLTAGEAALVIQAYRSTHRGANPTPAMVKQIIMSTATDLGAPADEQGAGLINSLAAVNAALSVQNGGLRLSGHAVLYNPTSADITDMPGTNEIRSFVMTNTGSTSQHVEPRLQTLGAPFAGANLTLQLGDSASYIEQRFYVPAGAQHLDAAIAWQTSSGKANSTAELDLLDPSGRYAADSNPQGPGSGYGSVDVVRPAAGYWTAIIWTFATQESVAYTGPVKFTWNAERFASFGSVSPTSFDLAPGASQAVRVQFRMPSQPGDTTAAIRFGQSVDPDSITSSEIPLTLRTLIPIDASGGGAFTGTLTGGNGRTDGTPTQTFAFDVPAGVRNMTLTLQLSDNGYLLEGLLIDPQGMPLSVQGNFDPLGNPQAALQLSRFNPQPGRWRFLLLQNLVSSGNQTSEPFTARIGFNDAEVTTSGIPNDPNIWLSASAHPVTVPITVRNNGPVTQAYFADARLNAHVATTLSANWSCPSASLPGACLQFWMPTEVTDVRFFAQSPAPIDMTAANIQGYGIGYTDSPFISAKRVSADTVVATLSVPEVPYVSWLESPSNIGPYGPNGAPTVPVNMGAIAVMQPFDRAVSVDSGDIWADLILGTNTYNPLTLAPGESGIINVTFTPDPTQVGKSISGFIYIDTFNGVVFTGDEVVRIPYRYAISK